MYEMSTLKHAFNARDMNSLVYRIVEGKVQFDFLFIYLFLLILEIYFCEQIDYFVKGLIFILQV